MVEHPPSDFGQITGQGAAGRVVVPAAAKGCGKSRHIDLALGTESYLEQMGLDLTEENGDFHPLIERG